jgi:predicted secreted hydrolase
VIRFVRCIGALAWIAFAQSTPPTQSAGHGDVARAAYSREWWRICSKLTSRDGHPLAFMATFFRYSIDTRRNPEKAPNPWMARNVVIAVFSITDLSSSKRSVYEKAGREAEGDVDYSQTEPSVHIDRWAFDAIDASLAGAKRRFVIRAADEDAAVNLEMTALRPAVAHQSFPYFADDPKAISYYSSVTRLSTAGTLLLAGKHYSVVGTSWIDHVYGNTYTGAGPAWDLYTLQLNDGRDITIYVGRRKNGRDDELGDIVLRDGAVRSLPLSRSARPASRGPFFWRSDRTNAIYPDLRQFSYPRFGLNFSVSPVVADQEIVADRKGISYWDGAVDVIDFGSGGKAIGYGFAQLTGYGKAAEQ